jgi:hypothetical protein
MEKINLLKEARGINTYKNVIDVDFSEFITQTKPTPVAELDIFDFFRLYNQLFYTIPLTGDNSHTTLIENSSQYVGSNAIDIEKQALIEEINTLKQQIVDLTETYLTVGSLTR